MGGGGGGVSSSGRETWPQAGEEAPSPFIPPSWSCHLQLSGDSQVWPNIPGHAGGGGGVRAPEALAQPRGDRKPGHRGLSPAAAAQPQPGRKFSLVLSAGASLAILLNRKPGSAVAGRWRRERRTPSPRAPCRDKWRPG